ncbi:MAG: hypothetical protein IJ632_00230 [Muribaculaceae bacterium]|nr:hypothetical protein [Muribaculaceae bacterium]
MTRHLLSSLILSGITALSTAANPIIYAYRNYQYDAREASVCGPVTVDAADPTQVTLLADQTRRGDCYAGTYYNYKWYAQITLNGTQSSVEGLYSIDLVTGDRTVVGRSGSQLNDMAYDYSSGMMYGIRNGNTHLMTVNLTTGATKSVGAFKKADGTSLYVLAIAATTDGVMYGVATDDNLYTIDTTNAMCTPVGPLGVDAAYTQSMCFDYATGTLYWANNGDYVLYTIDTASGSATRVGRIGRTGYDSLNSLFIPYIHVAPGAPDRVSNRSVSIEGNQVTLTWTNPATNAQGGDLNDLTGVRVLRNGEQVGMVTLSMADAGQAASFTDTDVPQGHHTYRLVPVNGQGDGGADTDDVRATVGPNAPGAVTGFTATAGNNVALLSWTPPSQGEFGGPFDPAEITRYVVRRTRGASTSTFYVNNGASTSFTDKPGFGWCSYTIAAENETGLGPATGSDAILVKPSDWIVMHNGEVIVDNETDYTFYDAGGTGYYPNAEQDTLTLRPATDNAYVTAKFTDFSLDYYDDLRVYDGVNTDAPLIGKFSATTVPAELQHLSAANSDGALTFVFTSDILTADRGWIAAVSTVIKPENDLAITRFTTDGYPVAGQPVECVVNIMNRGVQPSQDRNIQIVDLSSGLILAEAPAPRLSSMKQAQVTLSYRPNTVGDFELAARLTGHDDDATNDQSAPVAQCVVPAESKRVDVRCDKTQNLLVVPMSFMSDESISQTIYPAEHFDGHAGLLLKMLSYPLTQCTYTYPVVPLQVWLCETEQTLLTDGSLPGSQMTKVFDGVVGVTTGDKEIVIGLDHEFEYHGGNLAIMVHKNGTATDNQGVQFAGDFGDYRPEHGWTRFASGAGADAPDASFGLSAMSLKADVSLLFIPKPTAVTEVKTDETGLHGSTGIFTLDGRQVRRASSDTQGLSPGIYIVDGHKVVVH